MKTWLVIIVFDMVIPIGCNGHMEDIVEATDIELAKQEISELYPDGRIAGFTRIA